VCIPEPAGLLIPLYRSICLTAGANGPFLRQMQPRCEANHVLEIMKEQVEPSPKPKDRLAEALQANRLLLRENQKRQEQLNRQLETVGSLTGILTQIRARFEGYPENALVQIAPEREAFGRVIEKLFPAKTRLTTKAAAVRRIDQYLTTLTLRRADLERRLSHTDQYHQVLLETKSVTGELQKFKALRRARVAARQRARELKAKRPPRPKLAKAKTRPRKAAPAKRRKRQS
jgi:hypothetical protein